MASCEQKCSAKWIIGGAWRAVMWRAQADEPERRGNPGAAGRSGIERTRATPGPQLAPVAPRLTSGGSALHARQSNPRRALTPEVHPHRPGRAIVRQGRPG